MMKKMIRGMGALALCFCLSLGMAVSVHAVSGSPSAWAEEDVQTSIDAGLVPETLRADYTAPITRAQFCSLTAAVYETVTGTEITGRMTFTDTNDVHVEKMAYLGVVNGVGGGRFDPDGTLTREQAAAIIDRLAQTMGKPLADSAADFSDNGSISGWARASVGRVQAAGIMNGTGGEFSPTGAYTREQSIVTMLRTVDAVENGPWATVVSSGSCGGSVKWTLDSAGMLTISGTGEMKYYSPTKTPWYSFRGRIRSAVVGEGVTTLGFSALYGCTGLTSVTLPESLAKIDAYAFSGCTALTCVQIPGSVTTVGLRTFENCDSLVNILVDSGNPNYRSTDGVLFSRDGTELVCYPGGRTQTDYTIPNGVKTVKDSAFSGNDYLTSVTIPNSVETIESYAFENCGRLTDLTIDSETRLYWMIYGIGGINDLMTVPGTEYMKKVTIHSVDPRGSFSYTMTSLDDVEQLAEDILSLYPTYLSFRVPADRLQEFLAAIGECLDANAKADSYYYSRHTQTGKASETAVIRYRFDYINGVDIFPYHKGYTDELSREGAVLLKRSEEILSGIITPNMSEYEKVKAIHDWLVNNTTYVLTAPNAHSPKGPILDGQSVCEGYSEAFQLLCELSDIDCLYVTGDTTQGYHAWNKVKVDGVWYNVDVTWDDPTGVSTLRYDYFLISDSALSKDHAWDRDWLPASTAGHPADHKNSTSGSSGGNGSAAGNTPGGTTGDTSDTKEYTGGYWDVYVDQYGFTWVELEDAHWVLYINGRQYGQDIYESAQAEMAGFYTLDQYIRGYGFKHYLEHDPSEQTAWDVAPRERGW